jgi:tRNA splicing endonuclease
MGGKVAGARIRDSGKEVVHMGKLEGEFFVEADASKIEKLELLGAGVKEGEVLKLPLIEAAYFEGKGFLGSGESEAGLIELALASDSLAKEKFLVLKHLRDRGYIVRDGEGKSEFMRIYRKGIRIGEDRSESVIRVLREGEKPELAPDLERAGRMRKALIYAFVGKEGDILFVKAYRVGFD